MADDKDLEVIFDPDANKKKKNYRREIRKMSNMALVVKKEEKKQMKETVIKIIKVNGNHIKVNN